MNLEAWRRELAEDPDNEFLINGVEHGFQIVDTGSVVVPAHTDNYRSATGQHSRVERIINEELAEGRYVKLDNPPPLISALGAVPKASGGIRLIHDCSQPTGRSLNDYASKLDVRYQTLRSVTSQLRRGYYLAKVDLKSAYRSVGLQPSQYVFTGLQWTFSGDHEPTYMCDTRLCFGARKSPGIFHRLTQAVRRMMRRRGFTVVVYLDDFLVLGRTKEECTDAFTTLVTLLRTLGFSIAWDKVEGPTQSLVFLGVLLDSQLLTASLPPDKVDNLLALLAQYLSRQRASYRQLQQLAGKLAWAALVVTGGRIYLQRVLNLIRPLRNAKDKVRLSESFRQDIIWWKENLGLCNGRALTFSFAQTVEVCTDACDNGGGMVKSDDWAYLKWQSDVPSLRREHINVKETMTIIYAVYRWVHQWSGCRVVVYTDNVAARAAINKGVSRNESIMQHLRIVFTLSTMLNFRLECRHIPGSVNIHADAVSRLHSHGHLLYWFSVMSGGAAKFWNCYAMAMFLTQR